MPNIEFKLALLKKRLESAAFLVTKGESEREAHSEIVESLIILSELEGLVNKNSVKPPPEMADLRQVNKVNRRLKLWAKRPNQINSKILNAFLKLKRSGLTTITEVDLKNELPEERTFDSNFSQMKTIAGGNHGKVFEQYGENITIWSPVSQGVEVYERVVFEGQ